MCGRYFFAPTTKQLAYIISLLEKRTDTKYQTGEIFPSHTVPIITASNNKTNITLATWGFPNTWNNGITINARSETIFEKQMFKKAIVHGRCIIPASGFYEWKTLTSKEKQKYYFTNPTNETMYFAGVYQIFNNQCSFVILTKEANSSMSDIHNRMPVIIDGTDVHHWLYSAIDTKTLINASSIQLQHKESI
ncbi:MAG: SOS response-associated peptidase [Coprobacillaceae bacterium]